MKKFITLSTQFLGIFPVRFSLKNAPPPQIQKLAEFFAPRNVVIFSSSEVPLAKMGDKTSFFRPFLRKFCRRPEKSSFVLGELFTFRKTPIQPLWNLYSF